MTTTLPDRWLIAAVLTHLVLAFVHGYAHEGGHVALTAGQSAFVYTVILVGPIVGLAVALVQPRLGGGVVSLTMAGALIFGLVNHFVIISPDHVSQVAADWQTLFRVSAVLLMVLEAAGVMAGLRAAVRGQEVLS